MTQIEGILFYSDFNCPFCFALNERILLMGDSSKYQWRGIQHMPATSSASPSLVDQTELLNEVSVVRKRASEVSIATPKFRPNTRLANELFFKLKNATRPQREELRSLIYRAYWQEGLDISAAETLAPLCESVGLDFPEHEIDAKSLKILSNWQQEWEGEQFQRRLPAMIFKQQDKPLLGFPTFDLLTSFFSGNELPMVPETLAACEMKPKQTVLLVGHNISSRCNTKELEAAYQIDMVGGVDEAAAWCAALSCPPDMVVIDYLSLGELGLKYCSKLRHKPEHRKTALIVLLEKPDRDLELAAFDSGATDVMFDLTDQKICQARLDLQLRMKRSASLLVSLARLDYLTELPNRREFDRKFEEEWLRARRDKSELSVLLIDIDHFKFYNDTYGHSMGDDCLRLVARAMAKGMKRAADQLARYGGEEFVAVLPATPNDGAGIAAETIAQAVRDINIPHSQSSCAGQVTISVGVATMIPNANNSPRQLVEAADAALYQAKEQGRDRVVRH